MAVQSQVEVYPKMGFQLRLLLWIPALTYEGVLLSGGRQFASLGQMATLGFLGAAMGFLLASSRSDNADVKNSD